MGAIINCFEILSQSFSGLKCIVDCSTTFYALDRLFGVEFV